MSKQVSLLRNVGYHYLNIFNYRGRENRCSFIIWTLFSWLVYGLLCLLNLTLNLGEDFAAKRENLFYIYVFVLSIYFLIDALVSIAAAVRRFHDFGASGYFVLLFVVLQVGLLFVELLTASGFFALLSLIVYLVYLWILCFIPSKELQDNPRKNPFFVE
ncbi:DUF805 domain-containing protein [Psittacicella gerlachiana]|uniref:DUF805 domain-containing protein n=1 Tax=Psittacicella gerlachiana TaxID=2028574 RepID=A0A3A1YC08_9GAMM|nr:DUF805 domain-containing protein [Psittacicella gerlachiana]RIY35225.1 hypothetical protein CKF59_03905 [Psittacicella gerlachiana]